MGEYKPTTGGDLRSDPKDESVAEPETNRELTRKIPYNAPWSDARRELTRKYLVSLKDKLASVPPDRVGRGNTELLKLVSKWIDGEVNRDDLMAGREENIHYAPSETYDPIELAIKRLAALPNAEYEAPQKLRDERTGESGNNPIEDLEEELAGIEVTIDNIGAKTRRYIDDSKKIHVEPMPLALDAWTKYENSMKLLEEVFHSSTEWKSVPQRPLNSPEPSSEEIIAYKNRKVQFEKDLLGLQEEFEKAVLDS